MEPKKPALNRAVVSLMASLLLHLLLAVSFVYFIEQSPPRTRVQEQSKRNIVIKRSLPPEVSTEEEQEPTPALDKVPSVKTNPDSETARPQEPDYIGARDTQAAGEESPVISESAAPNVQGEEKDELVTFEQERQDGDLLYDGKESPNEAQPTPTPPTEINTPQPEQQQQGEIEGQEEMSEGEKENQELGHEGVASVTPLTEEEIGDISITLEEFLTDAPESLPTKGLAEGEGLIPAPQEPIRPPLYDPSFARDAQPGFRTNERRSRSTGRFVFGRRPALNVAATARGRYEELIYRRVAYFWYIACDERRGDIIPGSLQIRIIINARGSVTSMDLVQRRGASVSQQSFTFGAIRRASLPAIPQEVLKELVGDKMELLFEFNFD